MTGITVARILRALEGYYRADAEEISAYLRTHPDASRESLLVREEDGHVEIALVLPERLMKARWKTLTLDERCQVVEGASHFLVVCDRARSNRSTTHLELELQAEVDKWLVLSGGGRLDEHADRELRKSLYDRGTFLHPANTVEGERYRYANDLAARFTHKIARSHALSGRFDRMRDELHRFFRMGQEEKIRAIAA